MDKERFKYLLKIYLDNTIHKEELEELLAVMEQNNFEEIGEIADKILDEKLAHTFDQNIPFDKALLYEKVKHEIDETKTQKRRLNKWVWAAASLFVLFVSGLFWQLFIKTKHKEKVEYSKNWNKNEVELPKDNQAVITIDGEKTYKLLETPEEALTKAGIEINKTSEGELIFNVKSIKGSTLSKHTFYSPKGTSSTLILADGTKVWLNSGSKITYPAQFSNHQRNVSLEGEAYFDVVENMRKPFVVSAGDTKIEVVGTKFNVATNLEPSKTITTLVSGEVNVNVQNKNTLLKPGRQSITAQGSDQIQIKEVNLREVMAWKEGYFRFMNDDIETVLNKIKTWYDIQGYEIGKTTSDRFTGAIKRTRKLSELFSQLETISDYTFKIKEGRVYVMK